MINDFAGEKRLLAQASIIHLLDRSGQKTAEHDYWDGMADLTPVGSLDPSAGKMVALWWCERIQVFLCQESKANNRAVFDEGAYQMEVVIRNEDAKPAQ